MRLTEKETNIVGVETGFYRIKKEDSNSFIVDNCGNHRELNNLFLGQQKLGKLEDIEEEFGIDLLTFFKIRKHCYDRKPIFIKGKKGIIMSSCRVELCYKSVAVHTGDYGADIYSLKNYGKTWALTKEELQ